jgi:16S rRNA processing protein RimM
VAAQQPPPEAAGVTVARILRPHGRRGEVAAEILTDFPERLERLTHAELWDEKNSSQRSAAIRSCRLTQNRGGQAIFHFEGSDSISDAEELVGLEVRIPFSERMALPSGSYYVTDLIGCEVREKTRENDAALGVVGDVQFTGEGVAGTPLLVVDSARGELLIPLAREICVNVDLAARRIDVVLPEGLRELNRD